MKRDIFRGCKNLKDSDLNHVSIQNDLTREEQEQNFKLRQELKERKQKGEKVCIFNNSIILESDHPRNKAPTSIPKWLDKSNAEPPMTTTAMNMKEIRKTNDGKSENKNDVKKDKKNIHKKENPKKIK